MRSGSQLRAVDAISHDRVAVDFPVHEPSQATLHRASHAFDEMQVWPLRAEYHTCYRIGISLGQSVVVLPADLKQRAGRQAGDIHDERIAFPVRDRFPL